MTQTSLRLAVLWRALVPSVLGSFALQPLQRGTSNETLGCPPANHSRCLLVGFFLVLLVLSFTLLVCCFHLLVPMRLFIYVHVLALVLGHTSSSICPGPSALCTLSFHLSTTEPHEGSGLWRWDRYCVQHLVASAACPGVVSHAAGVAWSLQAHFARAPRL